MAARVAIAMLVGVLLLAGCGGKSSNSTTAIDTSTTTSPSTTTSTPRLGFEGMAIEQGADLASADTTGTKRVDGITCGPIEQLAYHIHAHLAVYVNGSARALPGGIGIPGSKVEETAQGPVGVGGQCIYWLHTHAPDGVIHVESPVRRVYTLGNFFDEWHQALSGTQVAGASGKVSAIFNGKPWTKDPRAIPLLPHAVIQLSVGGPIVPFRRVSWAGSRL